jgi:uncharacterized protein
MEPELLSSNGSNVILAVRLQPRASRTEIRDIANNELRISVKAPPVDGQANEALENFLAKNLRLPRSAVAVVKGKSARSKRISIAGLTCAQVQDRLFPEHSRE